MRARTRYIVVGGSYTTCVGKNPSIYVADNLCGWLGEEACLRSRCRRLGQATAQGIGLSDGSPSVLVTCELCHAVAGASGNS